MDEKEHIIKHKELHKAFDELMADFISHTTKLPSNTNLMELARWSHQQTVKPDVKE